uniref:Truncated C5-sterol desaturase n=1 Tax=Candida albicans TaxID=5476 RepID=G8A444_CANAX|nr:truncated C5-sterol desaturase [Candida albicans]
MDIVLEICDYYLFDKVYADVFPKDGAVHEFLKPAIQSFSHRFPKSPKFGFI